MQTSRNQKGIQADQIAGDRRKDRRYPIELELKYKLIRRRKVLETGKGYTVDLSSGGILFETDHPLPVGLNVELLVEWPVLLHSVTPMRLLVQGRIVRTQGNRAAVQCSQHEFRTHGVSQTDAASRRPVEPHSPLISAPPQSSHYPAGKLQ